MIAFVAVEGSRLLIGAIAPPACRTDPATNGLAVTLHDSFSASIAVNDARTLSNGLFTGERHCIADIAPLKSGLDAEHMAWRRVLYQVKKSDNPDLATVTAQLGDAVPLAPERSFYIKWIENFLD
jgi:hypothetical protein